MKFENAMDLSQNLNIVLSLALFSGDMYPLEPISKGVRFTLCEVISEIICEYFSVLRKFAALMFGSSGTVSSNIFTSS